MAGATIVTGTAAIVVFSDDGHTTDGHSDIWGLIRQTLFNKSEKDRHRLKKTKEFSKLLIRIESVQWRLCREGKNYAKS